MKLPLSPQQSPAQRYPRCWGTMSWHSQAPVFLPGQCRGTEGGRTIPCTLPMFSSYWIIPSVRVGTALQYCLLLSSTFSSEKAHFTEILLCSSPSAVFALFSLVIQAMLGLLFFPLQSLICSSVQHLTAAKISRANQPGHLDVGLPILTVYSICFMSYVWFGLCRALYYTKIRKHDFVLLSLGNKNSVILSKAFWICILIKTQRKSI